MISIPDDNALCLDCDYPLRGLSTSRCPECGRGFDPSDPLTYRLSSVPGIVQAFLITSGRRTDRGRWVCLGLMLWGGLLLPGGVVAVTLGACLSAVFFAVRAAEAAAQRVVARAYGAPLFPERRSRLPWFALAVLASVLLTGTLTRASLWLHAPLLNAYAHRVYSVEPLIGQRAGPWFIGGLWVVDSHVSPSGLTLRVGPGVKLLYDPDYAWADGPLGPAWHVGADDGW